MSVAIIRAYFYDQHVKAIRPMERLVEIESGDCIPIIRKPHAHIKLRLRLSDDRTYLKPNPRTSLMIRVAKKTILTVHSQLWVLIQLPWAAKTTLQPYTSLYEKISVVSSDGVICVTPNVPFKILIMNN